MNGINPWTLAISIAALLIALFNFRRKSSLKIAGNYTQCGSIECSEQYVSEIVMENQKDRAVAIHAIYLRLGHNNYIKLEEFEQAPLIIKPYEAITRHYDKFIFYSTGSAQVSLNKVFGRKVKKHIVLSTTQGKYVVKKNIHHWNPVHSWFSNHATMVVSPIRRNINGTNIGDRQTYMLELEDDSGKKITVMLHEGSEHYSGLKCLCLTQASLLNRNALEAHLRTLIDNGTLQYKSVVVHDIQEVVDSASKMHKKLGETETMSWFKYRILCRYITFRSTREMQRRNKEFAQKTKEASVAKSV